MPPSRSRKITIRQSLQVLGITEASIFAECETRDEEFSRIVKKTYFRMVLRHHPDKGGDAGLFREIQTSFELLRDLHNGKRGGAAWMFHECVEDAKTTSNDDGGAAALGADEEFDMSGYDDDFSNMETPSWEYYEAAAEEDIPIYRMERAKSGRSRCKQKGAAKRCSKNPDDADETSTEIMLQSEPEIIMKDEVRIGSLDGRSGGYSRWCHLRCWRVPYKVWLGLSDPELCSDQNQFAIALASMNHVLLSGFSELPEEDKNKVIRHAMDKNNWARKTKSRKEKTSEAEPKSSTAGSSSVHGSNATADVTSSSTSLVVSGRQRLAIPVPGKNGAKSNAFSNKTFVLTGLFPEAGGGAGLNLGKDKVKHMIESFGGLVRGSISGKTDVLVVGKEPGFSKVSKARASNSIMMMGLKDIADGLHSGFAALDDFPDDGHTLRIQDFSTGYGNNGLAAIASSKDLKIARGVAKKSQKKTIKEDAKKGRGARKPQASTNTDAKKVQKAKQEKKDESATQLVVAKPAKRKSIPKATTLTQRKKLKSIENVETMKISCDNCGKDCSKKSWFVSETGEDFCNKCNAKKPHIGAVAQCQGKDLAV